jgi:tRNA threonylcarbamoyl adenosine modification protein YeaZ
MTSCAISADPILILNCAGECIQVVFGAEEGILFAEEIRCPGQSIVHLPTAIERGLRVLGLRVEQLGGIACVRGPGSFTGLRIAHATMYGLARPFSLPMSGLELPALLVRQAAELFAGELWVLLYARKNQVYVQGFTGRRALTDIRTMPVDQVPALLAARTGPTALIGNGLRKNPALLDIATATILPAHLDTPPPAILLAAAREATWSRQPPAPLYLRKSDAEDNLDAIAVARGIDPAEARKHIFDFE